eukprot:jgi/Psemu1/25476/gm1.25476_g
MTKDNSTTDSGEKPDNEASKKTNAWSDGGTTGLEDDIFYFGKGMNTKWLNSKEKLLNYIGKRYSMSEASSIEKGRLILIGITKPDEIKAKKVFGKMYFHLQEEWKLNMKRYNETTALVNQNLTSCYAIIWGQLTQTLRNKIKAESDFDNIDNEKNSPKLFALVTKICNQTATIDHQPTAIVTSLYTMIGLNGLNMTFIADLICPHRDIKNADHVAYVKNIDNHSLNQFLALMFLRQAGDHYKECQRDLNNDFIKGTNHIPATIKEAYNILKNYDMVEKKPFNPRKKQGQKKDSGTGDSPKTAHTFQQGTNPNTDNKPAKDFQQHDKINTRRIIICYKCGREDHITPSCTKTTTVDGDRIHPDSNTRPYSPRNTGTSHVHFADQAQAASLDDFGFSKELDQDDYFTAYQFTQSTAVYTENMRGNPRYCLTMKDVQGRLESFWWVLIDNQSTVHIFWNAMFLVNVWKTHKKLDLHTNARSVVIDEVGELPGVGTVWLHRNGVANILSFHALQNVNHFEIDYSTWPNQQGRRFQPDGRGLYYLDFANYFGCGKANTVFRTNVVNTEQQLTSKANNASLSLANEGIVTVKATKDNFTNRDVRRAEQV